MKGQFPPPRRKAGNLRKAIILAGCLFLAVGLVEGFFAIRKRLAPAQPPPPAATLVAAGQVTPATYAHLVPGLLYTQASEVLGGPGRELSARDSAGTHRAVYQWAGPGGATMQAVFENDRLVRKSQVGLR